MKFCFLFPFKQINHSFLQRRSGAEEQFNLKSILFCCLWQKQLQIFHFCPQRENQLLLLAQLAFFFFWGGMQLIKDTISTTAKLPVTLWWEFNARRRWKRNLKAAEREFVCEGTTAGGVSLSWSWTRQRPSNWQQWLSICLFCVLACLLVWSTEVAQLAKSLSSIQHASSRWGVLEKKLHQKHHYRHLSRNWK